MPERLRLALDTNLLARPSSRRLLHGIALDQGFDLVVLPEVEVEALPKIGALEATRWARRLKQEPRRPASREQRIIAAVAAAASRWFERLMVAEDAPFNPLTDSPEQAALARDVALSLPKEAIAGREPSLSGDPLIVGQAVAHNVELLSTNNFRSMDHGQINQWLRKQGRNRALLHTPDETIGRFNALEESRYEWMIAYGPWQPVPDDEDACHERFQRALNIIRGAGFGALAEKARWDYQQDGHFMDRVRRAINSPNAQAAKDLESQFNVEVRAAASAAGWSR